MSLEFHAKELKRASVMAAFNLLCIIYSQVGQGVCFNCLTCRAYIGQTLIQVWLKSPEEMSELLNKQVLQPNTKQNKGLTAKCAMKINKKMTAP